MSKADKMFKELGYKFIEDSDVLFYQKGIGDWNFKDILFIKHAKKIHVENRVYNKNGTIINKESYITMEELQTINEKVKELGWNEQYKENKKIEELEKITFSTFVNTNNKHRFNLTIKEYDKINEIVRALNKLIKEEEKNR